MLLTKEMSFGLGCHVTLVFYSIFSSLFLFTGFHYFKPYAFGSLAVCYMSGISLVILNYRRDDFKKKFQALLKANILMFLVMVLIFQKYGLFGAGLILSGISIGGFIYLSKVRKTERLSFRYHVFATIFLNCSILMMSLKLRDWWINLLEWGFLVLSIVYFYQMINFVLVKAMTHKKLGINED